MDSFKKAFIPSSGQDQHETAAGMGQRGRREDDLNPDAQKELQQLRNTLQNNIQTSRMQHHAFEPLSLPGSQPVSRVCAVVFHKSSSFARSSSKHRCYRFAPSSLDTLLTRTFYH
jgi:hypothetical protein